MAERTPGDEKRQALYMVVGRWLGFSDASVARARMMGASLHCTPDEADALLGAVEDQESLLRVVRAVHALKKTRNPWLKEGRQATIALLKEYGTLPPHILARLNEEVEG